MNFRRSFSNHGIQLLEHAVRSEWNWFGQRKTYRCTKCRKIQYWKCFETAQPPFPSLSTSTHTHTHTLRKEPANSKNEHHELTKRRKNNNVRGEVCTDEKQAKVWKKYKKWWRWHFFVRSFVRLFSHKYLSHCETMWSLPVIVNKKT